MGKSIKTAIILDQNGRIWQTTESDSFNMTSKAKSSGSRMMRLARRRRARRQRLHKFVVALLVAIAFCSGFFGRTLFDAYAKEESTDTVNLRYTSIRLEPGDNLWKIADRYAEEAGYTVFQYVEELKRINQLPDGQVHSGEYLTIVYLAQ